MLKILFLGILTGATIIWTAQANKKTECHCRESLEQELKEYVKLESWQMLFMRHSKFIVKQNGDFFSERKRLKFNTIIHNAIYGCNHDRDDEIDDCPNIYPGSVKSCKHGKNIRSAMFRVARCSFVESSVKHIVMSDALLDTLTSGKLDQIYAIDKSVREFGNTIVNILTMLAHGERGGLGELMAMNLYLNNKFNTVFIHKIPVEPVTSSDNLKVAHDHMRNVHNMLLDKLYTFWDVWCSDKNIIKQYRLKYKNEEYIVILDEMNKNILETDNLVRSLNVSDNIKDFIDFDPNRIALTDFVNGLVSSRSMPPELLVDLQLKSFEASFEFNPQLLHEYHNDVFKTIYTSFYWTTISHLRLGVQILNQFERFEIVNYNWQFLVKFIKFIRPLTVFNINQVYFVPKLSPVASKNITKLLKFLLDMHYNLKNIINVKNVLFSSRAEMQTFIKLLSTDMETMLNMEVPVNYYNNISFDKALEIMQSNYQSFVRLVSATSNFNEDKQNLNKLKKSLLFLCEAIEFDGY